MSESIPISDALLRSLNRHSINLAADEAAWNSGERQTLPARKVSPAANAALGRSIVHRFKRQYQRSPDRLVSMLRKRKLAGCGALPDIVRCHYSQGQMAVLTVIALEVKRHGHCDLPVDAIAAQAGVCRTTVQNAVREARALGHIAVQSRPCLGKKNLTNIVTVTSNEWLAWIKRGPSRSQLLIGFKSFDPTKKEGKKEAKAAPLPPFKLTAPPNRTTARGFGGKEAGKCSAKQREESGNE